MQLQRPVNGTLSPHTDIGIKLSDAWEISRAQETITDVDGRFIGQQVVEGAPKGIDITAGIGMAGIPTILLQGCV